MPSMRIKSVRDAQVKSRMREIYTYGSVRDSYKYLSRINNKQNLMEVL